MCAQVNAAVLGMLPRTVRRGLGGSPTGRRTTDGRARDDAVGRDAGRRVPRGGRARRPRRRAARRPRRPCPARSASSPVRAPGKTRTITHRIAYGVHTGVYVPEQVLAVTFTARAAGELRARLAALDVGGVQARTFHAAAMRQLRYFAPAGARRPDAARWSRTSSGWWRRRPSRVRLSHRPHQPARPRQRDRVGQDDPGRRRRTTRPARRPPAGSRRSRRPRSPPSTPATSRPSSATACSTSRTCCWSRPTRSRSTPTSPEQVRGAVPALRRRRVPGRQPAAAAAARRLARRPRRRLRRRRPEPDHLLVHRRRPRLPARLRRPLSRRRAWSSSSATTAPRPQVVGAGQPADRPGAAGARACPGCGCSASAPTAAEPTLRRAPRRAGRGGRGRRAAAGR